MGKSQLWVASMKKHKRDSYFSGNRGTYYGKKDLNNHICKWCHKNHRSLEEYNQHLDENHPLCKYCTPEMHFRDFDTLKEHLKMEHNIISEIKKEIIYRHSKTNKFKPFIWEVGGKFVYPNDKDVMQYHHDRGFHDAFEIEPDLPFKSML